MVRIDEVVEPEWFFEQDAATRAEYVKKVRQAERRDGSFLGRVFLDAQALHDTALLPWTRDAATRLYRAWALNGDFGARDLVRFLFEEKGGRAALGDRAAEAALHEIAFHTRLRKLWREGKAAIYVDPVLVAAIGILGQAEKLGLAERELSRAMGGEFRGLPSTAPERPSLFWDAAGRWSKLEQLEQTPLDADAIRLLDELLYPQPEDLETALLRLEAVVEKRLPTAGEGDSQIRTRLGAVGNLLRQVGPGGVAVGLSTITGLTNTLESIPARFFGPALLLVITIMTAQLFWNKTRGGVFNSTLITGALQYLAYAAAPAIDPDNPALSMQTLMEMQLVAGGVGFTASFFLSENTLPRARRRTPRITTRALATGTTLLLLFGSAGTGAGLYSLSGDAVLLNPSGVQEARGMHALMRPTGEFVYSLDARHPSGLTLLGEYGAFESAPVDAETAAIVHKSMEIPSVSAKAIGDNLMPSAVFFSKDGEAEGSIGRTDPFSRTKPSAIAAVGTYKFFVYFQDGRSGLGKDKETELSNAFGAYIGEGALEPLVDLCYPRATGILAHAVVARAMYLGHGEGPEVPDGPLKYIEAVRSFEAEARKMVGGTRWTREKADALIATWSRVLRADAPRGASSRVLADPRRAAFFAPRFGTGVISGAAVTLSGGQTVLWHSGDFASRAQAEDATLFMGGAAAVAVLSPLAMVGLPMLAASWAHAITTAERRGKGYVGTAATWMLPIPRLPGPVAAAEFFTNILALEYDAAREYTFPLLPRQNLRLSALAYVAAYAAERGVAALFRYRDAPGDLDLKRLVPGVVYFAIVAAGTYVTTVWAREEAGFSLRDEEAAAPPAAAAPPLPAVANVEAEEVWVYHDFGEEDEPYEEEEAEASEEDDAPAPDEEDAKVDEGGALEEWVLRADMVHSFAFLVSINVGLYIRASERYSDPSGYAEPKPGVFVPVADRNLFPDTMLSLVGTVAQMVTTATVAYARGDPQEANQMLGKRFDRQLAGILLP